VAEQVADFVLKRLAPVGIEQVYTYPGDGLAEYPKRRSSNRRKTCPAAEMAFAVTRRRPAGRLAADAGGDGSITSNHPPR
jgi:hypothetical protein